VNQYYFSEITFYTHSSNLEVITADCSWS